MENNNSFNFNFCFSCKDISIINNPSLFKTKSKCKKCYNKERNEYYHTHKQQGKDRYKQNKALYIEQRRLCSIDI